MKSFKNEPFLDFSMPQSQLKMKQALAKVKAQFGKTYPLIINGKDEKGLGTFSSYNPSKKDEVIGTFQEASSEACQKAIDSAWKAFETWKTVTPQKRAQYLFKLAALIRKRKYEFCAWLIYEVGKTWKDADGEVQEAIDFLEYYGHEMIRLSKPPKIIPAKKAGLTSEKNEMRYISLGVGAIITPWNFPLAILTGMTTSAVVTGNTVVVKPSEFSPGTAFQFIKLTQEVGIPNGVINLLTGTGPSVGKYLVSHPHIRFISFTGSKKVGLEIIETAAKTQPGQKWIKKVIAEMGGKDAIVVDRQANLDDAVDGVVRSAFGYQGQKCSACSRAIIDETIYERFTQKLLNKVKTLKVAPADEPNASMGPLVSEPAFEKALQYIQIGKMEGKLLHGGKTPTHEVGFNSGYFIEPTVLGDVPPNARIAQEEIFGPVLALIKSKNFDEALEIANNTEYGLTGAVYTQNPKKIKRAKEVFHVGNFYINRGCTGAMVGVHPFGGFNMSGTDSKAGGPDYLLHFLQAKTISEKALSSPRRVTDPKRGSRFHQSLDSPVKPGNDKER